jgi:hypothetical protein
MPPPIALPAITALARSGAVDRAWALLEAGGYLEPDAGPAALAVKGRLLKDRARKAASGERQLLFTQAAQAYCEALLLDPAPYLAINAATARLLGGDPAGSRAGATATLAMLDGPEPPADTAYYLAATRAEALLLLGDEDGAQQAMTHAASHDPDGWDDRAVTLAQLRAIGESQGLALAWLDAFAPPKSLHFAGHMGIAAGGDSEAALALAMDELIQTHRPGFAWGALAAGADIVIAERLLAAGCVVHAVLPCPEARFEAQSVAPAGQQWLDRYRVVLAQAASVRLAGPGASSVHDPIATAHAGELAIGGALLNARRLGTEALQLIVADEAGGGANTRRQAALWHPGAGRQLTLTITRDSAVEGHFPPEQPDPARGLAVHVAIGLDGLVPRQAMPSDEVRRLRAPIEQQLARLDPASIRSVPEGWSLTLTDLDQALEAIADLMTHAGAAAPSIGVTLAIANLHRDQASGTILPFGPGAPLAARLQAMAPAGTVLASDALAVSLVARGCGVLHSELYHAGEPELGGAVHILS